MHQGLLKNNIIVTALNITSLVINFASQVVIASYFGADEERDAFFAATAIPTYINAVISGSLLVVFLPRLVHLRIGNSAESSQFIRNMITFLMVGLTLVTILLVFFSDELVRLLYHGFQSEKIRLTQQLLLTLCPALAFQALSNVIIAVYHSENKFSKASSSLIITPAITIILTLLLEDRFGITSVALGTSAGWVATFFFLVMNLPIRYSLKLSDLLKDQNLKFCLSTAMPLLLGGIIYRCNTIVERVIASNFPEGAISYLGYATSIISILSSITINGIATTVFPLLSQAWSERNDELFRKYFSGSLKITLMLCVPIIFFTASFSDTITATIFQRGAFGGEDTDEVGNLLLVLMGSFLFLCMNNIPAKIIYITGISKFGFMNALLEVVIYISLALLLTRKYSYYGLAYAQTISVAVSTTFNCFIIHAKFGVLAKTNLFADSAKIILCGVPMFITINLFYLWFEEPSFIVMILFGSCGFLVYYYLLSHFLDEAISIRKLINRKIQHLIYSK